MNDSKIRSCLRVFGSVFPVISLCLWTAFAQTAGARLEGIVKDASQAIVPGVTVTATNEGTNISTTTITNETGFYVFVNLPPGTYTLTSELKGFKESVGERYLAIAFLHHPVCHQKSNEETHGLAVRAPTC